LLIVVDKDKEARQDGFIIVMCCDWHFDNMTEQSTDEQLRRLRNAVRFLSSIISRHESRIDDIGVRPGEWIEDTGAYIENKIDEIIQHD